MAGGIDAVSLLSTLLRVCSGHRAVHTRRVVGRSRRLHITSAREMRSLRFVREPNLRSGLTPLTIKLLASHTQLTMAERSTFVVGVEVCNRGTVPADPQLATTCELAVNGNTSVAWNFAVNDNKSRDQSWSSLPPGETVSLARQIGVWLFPRPGVYRLVLSVAGQEAIADIQVTG
jgi:hypothetical protein